MKPVDTTELELEVLDLEEKLSLSRNETEKLVLSEKINIKRKEIAETANKKIDTPAPVVAAKVEQTKPVEKKEEDKKDNNARGEITNSGNTFPNNNDKKSDEKKN